MASSLGDIVASLAIDKTKWSAGLTSAGRDLSKFGDQLSSQLSKVNAKLSAEATKLVTGKGGSRSEIERLREERTEVEHLIRERELLLGVRKREAVVPPTQGERLVEIRRQIALVTQEYDKAGRVGGMRLSQLVAEENRLTAAIERQAAMADRARGSLGYAGAGGAGLAGGGGRGFGRRGTPRSSNLAAFGITQLGFGAEDFLSQVGPMGIGGGLRAAGNNLSVFAAALNPIAGLVVGVGTALASILIPKLLDTESAAEKAAKAVDKVKPSLEVSDDLAQKRREHDESIRAADKNSVSAREAINKQRDEVKKLADEYQNAKNALIAYTFAQNAASSHGENVSKEIKATEDALKSRRDALAKARKTLSVLEGIGGRRGSQEAQDRYDYGEDGYRRGVGHSDTGTKARQRAEEEARQADIARRRGLGEEQARNVMVGALGRGIGNLQQQKAGLRARTLGFDSPELVTKNNSIDKYVEILSQKGKDRAEAIAKAQEERLDKQIKLLEDIREAVKSGKPLKPARIG